MVINLDYTAISKAGGIVSPALLLISGHIILSSSAAKSFSNADFMLCLLAPSVVKNERPSWCSPLFHLDSPRRLAGEVIEYSVDMVDLVDDPGHDPLENIPWNISCDRSHEV